MCNFRLLMIFFLTLVSPIIMAAPADEIMSVVGCRDVLEQYDTAATPALKPRIASLLSEVQSYTAGLLNCSSDHKLNAGDRCKKNIGSKISIRTLVGRTTKGSEVWQSEDGLIWSDHPTTEDSEIEKLIQTANHLPDCGTSKTLSSGARCKKKDNSVWTLVGRTEKGAEVWLGNKGAVWADKPNGEDPGVEKLVQSAFQIPQCQTDLKINTGERCKKTDGSIWTFLGKAEGVKAWSGNGKYEWVGNDGAINGFFWSDSLSTKSTEPTVRDLIASDEQRKESCRKTIQKRLQQPDGNPSGSVPGDNPQPAEIKSGE